MSRLADLFFIHAQETPDKVALWCDGQTLTYKSLAEKVNQYSHFLLNKGVRTRQHLGLAMANSIDSVLLMLTAANLHLTLVPLSPTLPFEAVKQAFLSGDVDHVFGRLPFLKMLSEHSDDFPVKGGFFSLDGTFTPKNQGNPLDFTIFSLEDSNTMPITRPDICNSFSSQDEEDLFILTLTSGSTGSPKPISLSFSNKYIRAIEHIRLYDLNAEDRILAATPLYHSLAERLVIIPLILGATSILLPRFTPKLWLDCLLEQKVTFSIAVSAQLTQVYELIRQGSFQAPHLRCLVSSSALLPGQIKTSLVNTFNCHFHEMYGTSEASTITDIDFIKTPDKTASVGFPLPGVTLQILDDKNTLVPTGTIGEITCSTPLLCHGYYKQEDLFDKCFYQNLFRTGDLGYVDQDGYLYFSGRKKEVIITGGVNVYPQDVEACIKALSEVKDCAAFAYPDDKLGEIVAVAIVPAQEPIKKRSLQVQCARHLADYQQPHRYFFIDELPKNNLGKLQRYSLLKLIQESEENK